MKLRIESDEKGVLRVYEVSSGEELENVVDVSLEADREFFGTKDGSLRSWQPEPTTAHVTIAAPEVDVAVDAEIEQGGVYSPGQSVQVNMHDSSSNVTREGILLHREKDVYEVYMKDTGAVEDFPESWVSPMTKTRPRAQS